MSLTKKVPVFGDRDDQQTAPWPSIGIGVVLEFWMARRELSAEAERSKVVAPTAGSVTRSAFFPGINDIEKGYIEGSIAEFGKHL